MANIEKFEDILAWQKGRELTQLIYKASRKGEFSKDYSLKDQIRRACISVTSNIAEGFERGGNKEFIQFLGHAKGSCGEVRSQLYVALDEEYVSETQWQELHTRCLEVSRLLDGFIKYLQQTEIKGRKFQSQSTSQTSTRRPRQS
ncbi:four helix bundle protein [Brevifollis gellanilyticus]|uniref:Four helix bundle protein n=1 Tax=Brevifollis gellanilyticus TaxID=748831 RepID=A0A512MC35_9BACT|nr:four helix bundle protein [Brevifollis gellanilyticus]GEP44309.1 four helix bundle protein [Brevifollis gellanilyticus]